MRSIFILLLSTGLFLAKPCQAQDVIIQGRALDAKNHALPGVTIMVKGTTNGTITDAAGKFSLKGKAQNVTLVASYAGFASKEIDIGPVTVGSALDVVFTFDKTSNDLRYWCCTNHASPIGPHCDMDQEVLKKKFKCENFERQ